MEQAARLDGAIAAAVVTGALVVAPLTAPLGLHAQPAGVELTALVDTPAAPIDDLTQVGTDAHTILPGEAAAAVSFIDNPLFNIDTSPLTEVGQDVLNGVLGSDFGAQSAVEFLTGLDPTVLDMSGVGSHAGLLTTADQPAIAAASAASAASASAVAAVQTFVASEQSFVDGLVAQEELFNASIVAGQTSAVQDVFGDNTALADVFTQLFNAENTSLYYQESLLNGALFAQNGVDPGSLGLDVDSVPQLASSTQDALSAVDGLNGSDWAELAQLTPADWSQLVDAGDFSNFYTDVLPELDWSGLFSSIFPF